MSPLKSPERVMALGLFLLLPLVFVFLVLLPSRGRIRQHRQVQEQALARLQELPPVQPLTSLERSVIQAGTQEAAIRLPFIQGDADRLEHYHRTVSGLHAAWGNAGVKILAIRSTWDPIKGSFTLPGPWPAPAREPGAVREEAQLQAWVLEAQVEGAPAQLLQGMAALGGMDAILEPVGFRWELLPGARRQHLILRNLVLVP